MSKLWGVSGALLMLLPVAAPAVAQPAAHAGPCARGEGPAMLVEVTGFKARRGALRVQAYGGDPAGFFEKGRWLVRIDVPVPAAGPALVCVPVARGGGYAVSVRHDMDGDHRNGRQDGGGMSGNPAVSIADLLFRRKPAADRVTVRVGAGVTPVPVTLNYIQGMRFAPVAGGR